MNTSKLHSSFIGRIYLLTAEGFFSSLRPLLIFHTIMAVVLVGFPFFSAFLMNGFSLQQAFISVADTYHSMGLSGMYIIGTMLYILIWINRCVHTPAPNVYTQLPASVGEKLISMLLLSIIYLLISLLSAVIISSILLLAAPDRGGDSYWAIAFLLYPFGFGKYYTLATVASTLFSLHGVLLTALCMLHFRKSIFGFLAAALIEFFVVLTLISTAAHYSESLYHYTQSHPIDRIDAIWLTIAIFGVIDLALAAGMYYRLKTLQLK